MAAGHNLSGIHTFLAGEFPGDAEGEVWKYSDRDLQQIARNFAALSQGPRPLHRVPVVVSHDGREAYGWVRAARASGGHFFTDWQDVSPALAAAIKARRFDSVSAELRRDFKAPDGRVYPGEYLYRVSVLGADVPRVKGLAPLSAAKWFADRGEGGRKLPGVKAMADATPTPTPPAGASSGGSAAPGTAVELLEQQLLAQGIGQDLLDTLSEDQLVMLYRDVSGEEAGEGDAGGTSTFADDPAGMTREALIAELVGLGQSEADLQGMSDDELRALLTQLRGQGQGGTRAMSDRTRRTPSSEGTGNPGAGTRPPGPASALERRFADLAATVDGLKRQAAQVSATQRAALAQEQARLRDATKQRVYDTVTQLRKTNQVEAWELDESDPATLSLPQQLLLLDATTPVTRKFADASGKEVTVSRTPLDDALEALKKRPVRKFSELALRGTPAADDPEADAAKAAKEYASRRNKQTAGKG